MKMMQKTLKIQEKSCIGRFVICLKCEVLIIDTWNEKYFDFYPNNFNFCAVKKNYRKWEKLEYKKNKLKLDIDFLNDCKQLGVYPKFLIFKLPKVSNKDALLICKRLLCSTISKRNKELQHLSKELSLSENFYLHSFLPLTSTYLRNLY